MGNNVCVEPVPSQAVFIFYIFHIVGSKIDCTGLPLASLWPNRLLLRNLLL